MLWPFGHDDDTLTVLTIPFRFNGRIFKDRLYLIIFLRRPLQFVHLLLLLYPVYFTWYGHGPSLVQQHFVRGPSLVR